MACCSRSSPTLDDASSADPLPKRLSSRSSMKPEQAGEEPESKLCLEVYEASVSSFIQTAPPRKTLIHTRDDVGGFGPGRPLVLWTKDLHGADVPGREWACNQPNVPDPEPALTLSRIPGKSESDVTITEGDKLQEHVTELVAIEPFSLERRLKHGSLTYFWTPVDFDSQKPRFVLTQAKEGDVRGFPDQQPVLAEFLPSKSRRLRSQIWVYQGMLGNMPVPLIVITALWLGHLRLQQGKSRKAKLASGPI